MKKRAAAAILGILLSVSMGLEVPAAALDGGFTSGFTSEQTGEAQQPDAVEAEQPAVSEPETPSVDGSQQETSDTVQTPQENVSAGESVTDGFTSGSTENGDRTSAENPVQDVQGFENTDETDSFEVQETPEEAADMRASESSTIFEWKEWEQTSDGRFRLHKKKAVKAAVQIADVQSSDVPAEAGSADEQTADEFSDNSEAQDAAAVQNSGEAQNAEPADAATGTEGTDAAGTAEVTSLKDDYYTIADGIVAITTRNETGTNHTGYYLFDENGYLVLGKKTLNGTECASKISGDYYFTPADSSVAAAYKEYEGKGAALVPWKTTVGQMKKNYWLWNKDTKNFQYYGNSGKALTVAELDENAKAQNTYTGYFKINGEYYCLDENGTPRTGDVTLTVNGVSAQYYFEPAANDQEIPGKMFHDCWKMFKTSAGEQWRYYEPARKGSSKIGQLRQHGIVPTGLSGRKNPKYTYLIDKDGYLIKSQMVKASNRKYYITTKSGIIYKRRIITYNNTQYYVTDDGSVANWKNCWHRCPGAGNRLYYFGSTAGNIVKKTGWQSVTLSNGRFYGWFWFNANGNHWSDIWGKGGYFRINGTFATGFVNVKGKKYFFQPSTPTTRNGQLVKNKMFSYQNKTYYADADGALLRNGWRQVNGNWYCFRSYNLVTNEFVKRGSRYGYVDSTGKYTTGWVIVNDSQNLVRYINPDKKGYVTNESKWINGKKYYFDKNGYRINDLTNIYKGPYTFEVDRVNGVMTVYADSARTIPVKTIRVSVGNPWTPTPKGKYTLTPYSRWQALMGSSWGQYGTHVNGAGQGGIFVHSVACSYANSYNLPVSAYNKLGSPASHGCIRTCVGDAKWVYYNSSGSTIYIFDGTYNSNESFKGPLGRKAIVPARWKNGGYYDPTDPAA